MSNPPLVSRLRDIKNLFVYKIYHLYHGKSFIFWIEIVTFHIFTSSTGELIYVSDNKFRVIQKDVGTLKIISSYYQIIFEFRRSLVSLVTPLK